VGDGDDDIEEARLAIDILTKSVSKLEIDKDYLTKVAMPVRNSSTLPLYAIKHAASPLSRIDSRSRH
jgi:hypothetical protein